MKKQQRDKKVGKKMVKSEQEIISRMNTEHNIRMLKRKQDADFGKMANGSEFGEKDAIYDAYQVLQESMDAYLEARVIIGKHVVKKLKLYHWLIIIAFILAIDIMLINY